MNPQASFSEILEAAEQLELKAQAELVDILRRGLAERGRERVVAAAVQARPEFAAGECRSGTADEIVREAQS